MNVKQQWNNFPIKPSKFPFFYGWVILFAGTVGILMSAPGQTMGVSVFTDYLIDAIDISRNNLSLAYMIGTVASSFILVWAGKMYDKYGARVVGVVISVCLGFIYSKLIDILKVLEKKKEIEEGIYELLSFIKERFE